MELWGNCWQFYIDSIGRDGARGMTTESIASKPCQGAGATISTKGIVFKIQASIKLTLRHMTQHGGKS